MTALGWYPDPDDPNARRYWDGETWSAPLPKPEACVAEHCDKAQLPGGNLCAEHQSVADARRDAIPPKVGWELIAEQRGTAVTPRSCAVPTCSEARFNGEDFCLRHGPMKRSGASSRPTPVTGGSSQLVCPHCQVQGRVTSKRVKQKKGISGAKATGAVLTAGISILGTGLSRKEKVTEMRCGNCRTTWVV